MAVSGCWVPSLLVLGWWCDFLGTEMAWNVAATLTAAVISAGAAILAARWAAKSTMKNAVELQNRERRLEEKSCAALLSADLHIRLTELCLLLREPPDSVRAHLKEMGAITAVLDAALPRLGGLGQQGTANLLTAFNGLALLVRDAREARSADHKDSIRMVVLHIGRVVSTLAEKYDLDSPQPMEEVGVDLQAIGLSELKRRGL